MRLRNELFASIVVALAMSVSACDHASVVPTSPSAVTTPRITSVSPASLVQSDRPQTLDIHVDGLLPDGSITLFSPSGDAIVLTGSLVQRLADGLEISPVLSVPGPYALRASNSPSSISAPFAMDVQARVKPFIGSISPGTLTPAPTPQTITVMGSGFGPGLIVTVVNGQDGTVIAGDSIGQITATSFTLRYAFTSAGTYAVNLVSAAGDPSNTVTITAKNGTGPVPDPRHP